jgi:hypothetical protein
MFRPLSGRLIHSVIRSVRRGVQDIFKARSGVRGEFDGLHYTRIYHIPKDTAHNHRQIPGPAHTYLFASLVQGHNLGAKAKHSMPNATPSWHLREQTLTDRPDLTTQLTVVFRASVRPQSLSQLSRKTPRNLEISRNVGTSRRDSRQSTATTQPRTALLR